MFKKKMDLTIIYLTKIIFLIVLTDEIILVIAASSL
jgi:hypothetical protein